ncbi:hypothetical protein LTR36_010205 [Oleoguttula mirabilis]|uniref:Rpr2-domain-containing protein n=1 Tax=Oleoguttula mirabilis TaxID=1507867 RepID=A0AAV9JSA0_9PEZI|nr:hypothetical protein LTR36_010205 [Oleoguttula mirabilis]
MVKDKTKKGGVPNKHLHARISYLQQAATYLTLQGQGRPFKPLECENRIALPITEGRIFTGTSSIPDGGQAGESTRRKTCATIESKGGNFTEAFMSRQDVATDRLHSGGLPLHLSMHLRQVALKSQIRLHADIKHTLCNTCSTVLLDGQTCMKYSENLSRGGKKPHADVLVLECGVCGAKKRFPVGAKRQKRKVERQQAPPEISEAPSLVEEQCVHGAGERAAGD